MTIQPATRRSLTGALLGLVLFGPVAYGQTDRDAVLPFLGPGGFGGRANGVGQAFTGVADDYSALYYNPAGLGHLTHSEINLAFDHQWLKTDVSGESISSEASLTQSRLSNAGLVVPIPASRITVAVGFQVLRDFEGVRNIKYASGTIANSSSYVVEGYLGSFSAGAGYQVAPGLAVGGSVEFLTGRNSYVQEDLFQETGYEDEAYYFEIGPNYQAASISLGLMFAPITPLRIGLLLRSPQSFRVRETYMDESLTRALTYEYSTKGSYSMRLGTALTWGPLLVSSDVFWFDYSQVRFESDLVDSSQAIPDIDVGINRALRENYRSALGYAIGGEFLLPIVNVQLRGGYRREPAPLLPDLGSYDQTHYTMGISFAPVPQVKIDAAYNFVVWKQDTTFRPNPYETPVQTISENHTDGKLTFSLAFRF